MTFKISKAVRKRIMEEISAHEKAALSEPQTGFLSERLKGRSDHYHTAHYWMGMGIDLLLQKLEKRKGVK